jgi:lysozyme family protein
MADFKEAFKKTMDHEGGYVDDPEDPGGETYRGIARRFHPSWVGWSLIDEAKSNAKDDVDFLLMLYDLVPLNDTVEDFYKAFYWDRFWGDEIPDQKIASEVFDSAVNAGVGRAVTWLQRGLNILNRNGQTWPDIADDGAFGPTTLKTLLRALESSQDTDALLLVVNILQGQHYLSIMQKSPKLERFARGWLKRTSL